MRTPTAALAIAAGLLALPASAAAEATLSVDRSASCYREQSTVALVGSGYTPSGVVQFTRDGTPLGDPSDPVRADGGGQLVNLQLILPGLVSGQRELTYVATDQTNAMLSADVSLLVTATDVVLKPARGAPNRRLTISARGFFGGRTLYAHIVRTGKRPGKARNMRIGAIKGACKKVTAHKRLFFTHTAPGRYRVQFDTYRRYEAERSVKTNFTVTVYRRAGTARATALSPAS